MANSQFVHAESYARVFAHTQKNSMIAFTGKVDPSSHVFARAYFFPATTLVESPGGHLVTYGWYFWQNFFSVLFRGSGENLTIL